MIPLNASTARIEALEAAAQSWVNRPELRCQFAMAGIYKDAGWLPAALEIPNGDRDWARSQGRSLITPWVESSGYFLTVDVAASPVVGDLLGFRLGHALHHVAIMLRDGRMAHVFGQHGVQVAPCVPFPWARRIEKVWRPVTPEESN